LPKTVLTDVDLVIRGNVWWNGGADMPLGLGETTGCRNPACNATQLLRDNRFNKGVEPRLLDPSTGRFQPAPGSSLLDTALQSLRLFPLPAFQWADVPGAEPLGTLSNQIWVGTDFEGKTRGQVAPPGAYV
jgi:hypothetical protein